jgi:hypothetical protein
MEFKKSYCPKDFETLIYDKWLKENKFAPKKSTT